MSFERRELVSAAKELIDLLGLAENGTPYTVTKETTIEEIEDIIKKGVGLIEPSDEFTEETTAVIEAYKNPAPATTRGKKAKKEEVEETDQEVAERIHKENVADAPVNKGKKKAAPKAEEVEEEEEEDEKPVQKTVRKGQPKKAGEPGKPGIIQTIVSLIEKSGKKGISKAEMLEVLTEQFPDRNIDSMKATINVQVPNRISKEKFPLKKIGDDKWIKA